MKPKQYQILWGNTTSELAEKVRHDMKFGWYPLGGVAHSTATTLGKERNILVQAMGQD